MKLIRVVLADDHPVVLAGLRAMLDAEPDLTVVACAVDGRAAVETTVAQRPDVLVLDVALPDLSGLEVVTKLNALNCTTRILVLTAYREASTMRMMMNAGVCGYLLKAAAAAELSAAIRAVASGKRLIDEGLADAAMPSGRRDRAQPAGFALLSKREVEVLQLVAQGHSVKEVAKALQLSPRTLETYKTRAMDKLQMKSRTELVRFALLSGWLREI